MSDQALLLACPSADLDGAAIVAATCGLALLPAGGVGDLERCTPLIPLYLVAIGEEGPQPAATWSARLLGSLSLVDPEPVDLLPPTWRERHADAYARARSTHHDGHRPAGAEDDDEEDGEDGEDPRQLFIPVRGLAPMVQSEWLFTNELVPKQARGGRRFAPRVPTLVQLPG